MRGKNFGAMNVLFLAGIQSMILPGKSALLNEGVGPRINGILIQENSVLPCHAICSCRENIPRSRGSRYSLRALLDALFLSLGRHDIYRQWTRV